MTEETGKGEIPWTVGDIAKGIGVAIALLILLIVVLVIVLLLLGVTAISEQVVIVGLLGTLALEVVLLLVAWRFSAFKYRCGWSSLGFRSFNMKRASILVAVVLLAALLIDYLYSLLMSSVGIELPPPVPLEFMQSGISLAIIVLLSVLVAPFAEEIFFRGFIFTGIGNRYGYVWGALASALLFALAHGLLMSLVPIFILGLFLAWLYLRTHSIWTCVFTHFAYNSIALLFLI